MFSTTCSNQFLQLWKSIYLRNFPTIFHKFLGIFKFSHTFLRILTFCFLIICHVICHFYLALLEAASKRFFTDFLQDLPTPGTGGPTFDTTVPSNITGLVGKTVKLTCRVKNLGNRTVS